MYFSLIIGMRRIGWNFKILKKVGTAKHLNRLGWNEVRPYALGNPRFRKDAYKIEEEIDDFNKSSVYAWTSNFALFFLTLSNGALFGVPLVLVNSIYVWKIGKLRTEEDIHRFIGEVEIERQKKAVFYPCQPHVLNVPVVFDDDSNETRFNRSYMSLSMEDLTRW